MYVSKLIKFSKNQVYFDFSKFPKVTDFFMDLYTIFAAEQ